MQRFPWPRSLRHTTFFPLKHEARAEHTSILTSSAATGSPLCGLPLVAVIVNVEPSPRAALRGVRPRCSLAALLRGCGADGMPACVAQNRIAATTGFWRICAIACRVRCSRWSRDCCTSTACTQTRLREHSSTRTRASTGDKCTRMTHTTVECRYSEAQLERRKGLCGQVCRTFESYIRARGSC